MPEYTIPHRSRACRSNAGELFVSICVDNAIGATKKSNIDDHRILVDSVVYNHFRIWGDSILGSPKCHSRNVFPSYAVRYHHAFQECASAYILVVPRCKHTPELHKRSLWSITGCRCRSSCSPIFDVSFSLGHVVTDLQLPRHFFGTLLRIEGRNAVDVAKQSTNELKETRNSLRTNFRTMNRVLDATGLSIQWTLRPLYNFVLL